jgi:hypothetical protein
MRPHADDLDRLALFDDLINQAVLGIETPGVQAAQFSVEFPARRVRGKRVFFELEE